MKNTLLLVDDEPYILKALKRTLEDEDFEIFTANSGVQALELLSRFPIKVILSDQRMPKMLGSEFLAEVKRLYPHTIRMVLSGYADFNAIMNAVNEGSIYKFLNKPCDEKLLRKTILDAFTVFNEQEKNEKQVFELTQRDPLTGLYNRFSFHQSLSVSLAEAQQNQTQLAVLYLDIDRFSKINTTFGYHVGDEALKMIAARLQNEANNKYIIARYGNDGFVILITDLTSKSTTLQNLLTLLKEPLVIENQKHYITVSIGVSIYPKDAGHLDSLMKCANLAMIHCREMGGDNYEFYTNDLDKRTSSSLISEVDLHIALEKNQFVVYYQPIVDTNTRKIVGAEALIRWQHPIHGLLFPDKFISLCEETGLIVPIGEWVLRTVCHQLKHWSDLGYTSLSLAVNFSARQFNHESLLDTVKEILLTTEINPACLKLEITESMIMRDIKKNIALLNRLRELGLQLSLDDFGTGYSSLNYLRQFPFNILKIDKSFIQEITTNQNSKEIVITIISLAKHLSLTIVAEGVETEEQFSLLKTLNCDLIQGYLFSKPIPEQAFSDLLNK